MNKSSIKISKKSMEKSLRINLQGKISTNKFSKGKISIFQRKNLQNHIPKEKSPINKSLIKISKTSMEKSLRINLQGKISIFQRKNLQNHIPNLHEQIFLKNFQKSNGKISRINLQGKISMNRSSKGKISKTIFQGKISYGQIFIKVFQNCNGKISWMNFQGKISIFQRKNLHE